MVLPGFRRRSCHSPVDLTVLTVPRVLLERGQDAAQVPVMAVSVWVLEGVWQRALTVSRFYRFGLLRYHKVELSLLEQADQRNPSGDGLTSVHNGLQPWVLAIGIGHSKAIHNGVRVRIEDDRENRPRIALYVREGLQDLRARGLDISAEIVSRKPDAKPMVVVRHYRIGTPVIPFPKLLVYCTN